MAKFGDYKLKGLKDSRIFYLRNPPKFMFISIVIVIAILLGAVVWSCVAVKAEQVENAGIVSDIGVNSISSDVGGTVISIQVKEGFQVEKGDVIFVMDSSTLETERAGYAASLEYFQKRLELADRYIASINEGRPNPFINQGVEQEFYELRMSYDSEMAAIKAEADSVNGKYLNNAHSQKNALNDRISAADAYKVSQDKDKAERDCVDTLLEFVEAYNGGADNPFDTSSSPSKEYYYVIEAFKNSYNNGDDNAKIQLKGNYALQFSTKRSELTTSIQSAETYVGQLTESNERLNRVNTMIMSLERKSENNPFDGTSTDPIEREYYDLFDNYVSERNQLDKTADSTELKYLNSMQSDRNTSSTQVLQLEMQVDACDANIEKYSIKAPTAGTVHLNLDLQIGRTIQAGTAVGNVNSGSGMEIDMYLSGHDRARISLGDECKFTVDGLMQSEYGVVKGTVKSIANDATMTENGAFFKVVVSFTDPVLVDKDGNEIEIVNGMSVRVWTIYEKYTYMEYFLDRLGL